MFKKIAILAGLSQTLANFDDMTQSIISGLNSTHLSDSEKAIVNQKLKNYVGTSRQPTVRGMYLNLGSFIMIDIKSYGCWCNFNNGASGKGQPVDDIDMACKNLFGGYKCANVDDVFCDATTVTYNSPDGFTSLPVTIGEEFQACTDANPGNTCGASACAVEKFFIAKLLRLLISEGTVGLNASFKHDSFDPNVQCNVQAQTGDLPAITECCGTYPSRMPYRTSFRGCCDNKLFSVATHCCSVDQVMDVGTC
jgi:hypothetical protein